MTRKPARSSPRRRSPSSEEFVQSISGGPAGLLRTQRRRDDQTDASGIPVVAQVPARGKNSRPRQRLFRLNCASCPTSTGRGSPSSQAAPNPDPANEQQICHRLCLTGPQNMLKFATASCPSRRRRTSSASSSRYRVHPARRTRRAGSAPSARGIVMWVVGIGAIVTFAMGWDRGHERNGKHPDERGNSPRWTVTSWSNSAPTSTVSRSFTASPGVPSRALRREARRPLRGHLPGSPSPASRAGVPDRLPAQPLGIRDAEPAELLAVLRTTRRCVGITFGLDPLSIGLGVVARSPSASSRQRSVQDRYDAGSSWRSDKKTNCCSARRCTGDLDALRRR